MKYVITPTAMTVHTPDESPVFGELTTVISLDDEGAGEFYRISQLGPTTEDGTVKLEGFEHVMAVAAAAKALADGRAKSTQEPPAPAAPEE